MAFHLKLAPVATALAALLASSSFAQTQAWRIEPITVTGMAEPLLEADHADVGGFATPLAKTPQSVTVFTADLLAGTAAQSLSQIIRLDASLADSYNTTGYIESLSIRGFLLDQSGNFSRNGLAISNYAPIALENKERVEVLKGVASLQSGVSAPGGLVNYVTKVPMKQPFTTATLGMDGNGGAKVHVDTNTTIGAVGLRLNLVDEQLHSHFDQANGSRQLVSLALSSALGPDTSVSADIEYHRKSQPSVPGLGLLDSNADGVGDTLPGSINPRLNLNNQSWSLPFQSTSTTAQVALNHRFNADWSGRLALATQNTEINDRIAFPDGCGTVYPGLCGNGDVDVYDFRSEGEKRKLASWDAHVDGKFKALGVPHAARFGMNGRSASADLAAMQAYNFAGTSNIYTPIALPADPSLTVLNTNSRERAVEGYATLTSDLGQSLQSFVGLRVSRLNRSSELSDGTQAVSYEQTVSTPWAGLAWSPSASTMVYASWGQGVELEVVPNRPNNPPGTVNQGFVNYGQTLPALKSEQTEIGVKWQFNPRLLLTGAAFSIDKPYADDRYGTGPDALRERVAGAKTARHRGLELAVTGRVGDALSLQASMMALDATYTQAVDSTLVGQRVTNVPRFKSSLFADYKLAAFPGLALNALATFESAKTATPDGSVQLAPSWQLDAGLRYQQRIAGKSTLWRLNFENVTNRIYWREAPSTSWGGIYIFPSTPRTVRASVTVDF